MRLAGFRDVRAVCDASVEVLAARLSVSQLVAERLHDSAIDLTGSELLYLPMWCPVPLLLVVESLLYTFQAKVQVLLSRTSMPWYGSWRYISKT